MVDMSSSSNRFKLGVSPQGVERQTVSELNVPGGNVDVMELMGLLADFQSVERRIWLPRHQRWENDVEHSYNLAMVAWVIIELDELPLDAERARRYALVHDLVEVYAGDSPALDEEAVKTQAAREQAALVRLKGDFLTAGLAKTIEEYERRDNQESQFIWVLDGMMATFTLFFGQVDTWRQHGLTKEDWLKKFHHRNTGSPYLLPYYEVLKELADRHPELFAQEN